MKAKIMPLNYTYKPLLYFIITFICSWIPSFLAAYFSYQNGKEKLMMLLIFIGLFVPCIVALVMIFGSKNQALIYDFWKRLFLYKIDLSSIVLLFFIIPGAFFLAIALSLLFGKSTEQFDLAEQISVIKGWNLLSLFIPLLLAPILEELGWRGYGVDSLRSYFNPLTATLLFGVLWSLWHLPLCFIKGYYQYELRSLGMIYVANFFISVIPAAIVINWLYFKNSRSILIAILAHATLNGLSILFKTEQLSKCLFTVILAAIASILIAVDGGNLGES